MNELSSFSTTACAFLLNYLLHSTVIVAGIAVSVRALPLLRSSALRVAVWKAALLLPVVTAVGTTFLPFSLVGFRIDLVGPAHPLAVTDPANVPEAILVPPSEQPPILTEIDAADTATRVAAVAPSIGAASRASSVHASPGNAPERWWCALCVVWGVMVLIAFGRLGAQAIRLARIRRRAELITDVRGRAVLDRIAGELQIVRPVRLYASREISGAFAAGLLRPFIMIDADALRAMAEPGRLAESDSGGSDLAQTELEALLAHELAHVAHRDAFWNLVAQAVKRLFPFQPLNRIVGRELQIAMDFAADERAVRVLGSGAGLVQCLLRFGDQLADRSRHGATSGLVAGMAAIRSILGRRVESLMATTSAPPESRSSVKLLTLLLSTAFAFAVAAVSPQAAAPSSLAVPATPLSSLEGPSMKSTLLSVAALLGLAAPLVADESGQPTLEAPATVELKETPDDLPPGIRQFNGMLVGRLAAKDIEKGAFVVVVDAVPRVWRNSRAEDPKSIVGKTVRVEGVFGRFLDVLVTARRGETLEFECKSDGDALVFPGELLRKVAAYDPADYPVLPEAFRGFRGALVAEIKKKDPETFELIVEALDVKETWKESEARNPESAVGQRIMLAGFWNRKDAYYDLKEGDRIEVGVHHIGRQSDHLTVAEFVRPAGESAMRRTEEGEPGGEKMSDGVLGFRGMLVGRLVKKDVERGAFTITVDAVPRVWENNTARSPKSLIGRNVDVDGVPGQLLDVLVVARIGETLELGALSDGGETVRVGEVLRKVGPVEADDYPVLPDAVRGFSGVIVGKVVEKDEHLLGLIVEIVEVSKTFEANRAENAEGLVGRRVMLSGFWNRKEIFHGLSVGDSIQAGVNHPQRFSDELRVVEEVKKVVDR